MNEIVFFYLFIYLCLHCDEDSLETDFIFFIERIFVRQILNVQNNAGRKMTIFDIKEKASDFSIETHT